MNTAACPHAARPPLHLSRRLITAIQAYIDGWNKHPEPFTWTKTADELLAKIGTPKIKTSDLKEH